MLITNGYKNVVDSNVILMYNSYIELRNKE